MKDLKINSIPEGSIVDHFKRSLLLVLLVVISISCKKEDDKDLIVECTSCIKYELINSWNAWYIAGGNRVTLQDGYIELNNELLTYKRFYKGFWHTNDAGLGGFSSEFENWTHKINGDFEYAGDTTYLLFDDSDTAYIIPAHWSYSEWTGDSTYYPARLKYSEGFDHDFFSVYGFFVYEHVE